GLLLAALDARDSALSFYVRQPDGAFRRTPGPAVPGLLPVALAAQDLDGDGLSDLVVAAAGSSQVFVFFQSDGSFGPAGFAAPTGPSPSSVTLADVNGDGWLDVVTTNDFSGDVSLFLNLGGRSFAAETRYRSGSGA